MEKILEVQKGQVSHMKPCRNFNNVVPKRPFHNFWFNVSLWAFFFAANLPWKDLQISHPSLLFHFKHYCIVLMAGMLTFLAKWYWMLTLYRSWACESMLSLTVQKHARACCHLQFRAWESMFLFLSVTCPGLLENDWLMYPGYKCTLYPMFDKDKCHWNMGMGQNSAETLQYLKH